MKTPPFLLGATLLFWGWHSGFLIAGAVMAVVLEAPRFIKARLDLSDEDFSRIWIFCTVALLTATVYAFTANEGPTAFGSLFHEQNLSAQNRAGASTARTAIAVIRWFPMAFFLFVAAQVYSTREGIPLQMISLILRRRWKKAALLGQPVPPARSVNVAYPYFAGCMFAASAHSGGNTSFFVGLCALLMWALWSLRSPRFGLAAWAGALTLAVALGYLGQLGITQLQHLVENFNPQLFSGDSRGGFDPKQSRTRIGQIGRIKTSGKIVIRLQPKKGDIPAYLREASYRTYGAGVWHANETNDDFMDVPLESDGSTWILQPGKTNTRAINIACYLEDGKALLPLPTGSGRLEDLQVYPLKKNNLGAVLAEGPGLVIFDALYGPGSSIDSPPNTNEDLSVPPEEAPALEKLISELQPYGTNRNLELQSVFSLFATKFNYSLWQRSATKEEKTETALTRFLLRTRSGHCEMFASATVLLLRQLHIPARYAVGYAVHETSGSGYVVRLRDAHAWCLVWNESTKTWDDFDTTPGSWVKEEGMHAAALQWASDMFSWLGFQFSKFRWGQTHLRQYLLWALVPVLAALLYQIIFRKRRPRQNHALEHPQTITASPGLDSEFYELERELTLHFAPRDPSESLSVWLQRAATHSALAEIWNPLYAILRLHYRYRFDPQGLTPSERDTLQHDVHSCLKQLALTQPPRS
ncbi:MAG: putative Transglutaminase protein [Pedosphaera sp.]|nr:putative Transglutaminase protein [Pedosphaera sp.]